jgi:hypothetical protein
MTMRKLFGLAFALLAFLAIGSTAMIGCGDDSNPANPDGQVRLDGPTPDSSTPDGGGPDADCFMNPQTHVQIINACTNAQKFNKMVVIPGQLPDGALPPLP